IVRSPEHEVGASAGIGEGPSCGEGRQPRHAFHVDADSIEASIRSSNHLFSHSFPVVGPSIELPLGRGLVEEGVEVRPTESPPPANNTSLKFATTHILADRPSVKPKHVGGLFEREQTLHTGDLRVTGTL